MEEQIEAALEELAQDAPEGFALRLTTRWSESGSSTSISTEVAWNAIARGALIEKLSAIFLGHGNVSYVDVIVRKKDGKCYIDYFQLIEAE